MSCGHLPPRLRTAAMASLTSGISGLDSVVEHSTSVWRSTIGEVAEIVAKAINMAPESLKNII